MIAEDIKRDSAQHQGSTVIDGTYATIPGPYKRYVRLFQEEVGANALPPHGPWDYEVNLIPGAKLPFSPLYKRTEQELKYEKEWTDKMLKKKWIRLSKSLVASSAFFVPKKGKDKFRTVIDYRQLNAATEKDRFLLPNIEQAIDRLVEAN